MEVEQPKTLDERRYIANRFVKDFNYNAPIVVDSMENTFETYFAAWPARYWIIFQNKIVFLAQPEKDHTYHFQKVRQFLKQKAWQQ